VDGRRHALRPDLLLDVGGDAAEMCDRRRLDAGGGAHMIERKHEQALVRERREADRAAAANVTTSRALSPAQSAP
jgi:hypothetical protein